jgi:hypothetical protein
LTRKNLSARPKYRPQYDAGYFKITAGRLAADITRAVGDTTLRSNAVTLGEKIRIERGVEWAVELIQKHPLIEAVRR